MDGQGKHYIPPTSLKRGYNHVSPAVYERFSGCRTYEAAIDVLRVLSLKPTNKIYARHLLATHNLETGETLNQCTQALRWLRKDCNFQAATAEQNGDDATREAFIHELQSVRIRRSLLENVTLDLQTALDQVRAVVITW